MTRRSPARYLAPIAVVAVVVALIAVIGAGIGGGGTESDGSSASTTTPAQNSNRGERRREPATYTVRAGDSLTVISEKTGVSVTDLEDLNPDIDPAALQAGEKLKLR